jgi:23S rRNA pseudouridine1911/1915/1917 synthase
MSALGHPIIGDFDYGGKHPLNLTYRSLDRGNHALHAYQLSFVHPCTQQRLTFTTPPPPLFIEMAQLMGLALD